MSSESCVDNFRFWLRSPLWIWSNPWKNLAWNHKNDVSQNQEAVSLTNWRKSRKNDITNRHLWRDVLASPRIPNAWHHHRHFKLLLITPFRHKSSLWRLVMTWRHFNRHQSSFFIIFYHFSSFSALACTKMTLERLKWWKKWLKNDNDDKWR